MATTNITQLRRMVFIRPKPGTGDLETFELGPDNLGQDTIAEVDITPRTITRSSSLGTTETPISGTYDNFTASVTFLMDDFSILGKALGRWANATYAEATNGNGNMVGSQQNLCGGDQPVTIVLQGVCDDGSSADIALPRCYPATDGALEFGGTEVSTVTLALHPVPYNPALHSDDGLEKVDYRFGDYSLTEKMRLDATTGKYQPATSPAESTEA